MKKYLYLLAGLAAGFVLVFMGTFVPLKKDDNTLGQI